MLFLLFGCDGKIPDIKIKRVHIFLNLHFLFLCLPQLERNGNSGYIIAPQLVDDLVRLDPAP